MQYVGIDPGVNGSVCIIEGKDLRVFKLGRDEEVKIALDNINPNDCRVVLEKVHAYPYEGTNSTNKQGVNSVWTFAENYGMIKMYLMVKNIKYIVITPQTWLKGLGINYEKGLNYYERKKRIHEYIVRMYPNIKIPKYSADAVAIATYNTLLLI